jgi:hypothetical protein
MDASWERNGVARECVLGGSGTLLLCVAWLKRQRGGMGCDVWPCPCRSARRRLGSSRHRSEREWKGKRLGGRVVQVNAADHWLAAWRRETGGVAPNLVQDFASAMHPFSPNTTIQSGYCSRTRVRPGRGLGVGGVKVTW